MKYIIDLSKSLYIKRIFHTFINIDTTWNVWLDLLKNVMLYENVFDFIFIKLIGSSYITFACWYEALYC